MGNSGSAKIVVLKRELSKLIELVSAEKTRYDALDYSSLTDDEAGEVGDDHELVSRMLANLSAIFEASFEDSTG